MKIQSKRVIVIALIALLTSVVVTSSVDAHGSAVSTSSRVVPASSGAAQFRGRPPISSGFDEQLGITFTQNFTSLEYNVTAVEQVDPTLGTGPGYLLSGLTNAGEWYQVGLSWDWSPGVGFQLSYEVFNQFGTSVFPQNGGGLAPFSGTVNPGDNVTLDLYFADGQVVMFAKDTATGASAQESYDAGGGTIFVGEPNSDANSNGFFTGLMTEWYHGQPDYANPEEVVFSSDVPVSSGWMWMDEFDANTGQLIFASNATAVSSFTPSPTQLQELSYDGVTEYSSAFEFITGASTSPITSTTSTTSSSAGNTTVASTSTVTTTVPTTVTTTIPTTVTETSTATATTTATQSVTTTVTSVQSTTTTTTQIATKIATGLSSLPAWAYIVMVLLLLAGLSIAYALNRVAQTPP